MNAAERAELDDLLVDAKDLEDTSLQRAIRREFKKGLDAKAANPPKEIDLMQALKDSLVKSEPTTIREEIAAVEEPDAEGHPFALVDPPTPTTESARLARLVEARTLPLTLDEAMQSLAIVEESYAESVDTFMLAFEAWQKADLIQARTRVQCVRDLMRPVGETTSSAGLSASAAEKQASDHPIYTNAKDHVAELALNKAEAEADRDLLLQSLKNARAILYALIAREGARESARTDTALLDFLEEQGQRDEITFAPGGPTNEDCELRIAGGVYVAQTVRGSLWKAMHEARN